MQEPILEVLITSPDGSVVGSGFVGAHKSFTRSSPLGVKEPSVVKEERVFEHKADAMLDLYESSHRGLKQDMAN